MLHAAAAADSDDAKCNTIFLLLLPHPPPKQLILISSPFRADSMYRDDSSFDFSPPIQNLDACDDMTRSPGRQTPKKWKKPM
jgi:hypothetical protein